MRNTAAKLTFVILKFNVTFTRAKPKVNVQLRWISRFSKSSWTETTAIGLSDELGVNGAKKLMETAILLIKMDIAHFTQVNMRVSVKKTYGY